MDKIWRKLNEFIRKITTRKSASGRSGGYKTTTIDSTYHSTADEFYIGVTSEKPVTVYLPAAVPDGKIIIIKAEMRPPMGSRKVNVATTDGSKIDGYTETSITVSHGCLIVIRNRGEWFIIS